ncbi:MAG: hypothetical protein O7H41_19145 [Planctomycetota bacterium]|nr:hypothetical protein [Planctomycetota bacterium]
MQAAIYRRSGRTLLMVLLGAFLLAGALTPPTASAQRKRKKPKQDSEAEDALEGKETRVLLTVTPVFERQPDGRWVIVVKGTTQLPDRLEFLVSLYFAQPTNEPIEVRTHVPVEDGTFGIKTPLRFGPYETSKMPRGWYWVVVRFVYNDQSDPVATQKFRQGLFHGPEEWKEYIDFSVRAAVRVGTPAQAAQEDRERKKYYSGCTKALEEIMIEFEEAYVSALRAGFSSAAEWKAYVEEKRMLPEKGDELDRRLDLLKGKGRFVSGGKLKTKDWREFLDREKDKDIATHPLKTGGLRGRIARVMHDHKEFKKTKLAGKLHSADERIDKLIPGLYGLTMRWSRILYKKAGLQADILDKRPAEPITPQGKPSFSAIRSLRAMVDKEVLVFLARKGN